MAKEYVVYIGGAGTRTIFDHEWKRAGIEATNAPTVQWGTHNGYQVPRESLSFLTEDEFNRYIRADGKFAIVEK
jgi:hypothetical protein